MDNNYFLENQNMNLDIKNMDIRKLNIQNMNLWKFNNPNVHF
jgi:hypothetical protein